MGLAKDHEEERGRRKKGQVTMGVTRRHGVELLAPRTGLVEQKQPKWNVCKYFWEFGM